MIRLPDPLPGNRPVSALRDCVRRDAWESPAVRCVTQPDGTVLFYGSIYLNSCVCMHPSSSLFPNQMCPTHATKPGWPVPVPVPAAVPAVQGEEAEQRHRKRWTDSCCRQRDGGASSKKDRVTLHAINHNTFIISSQLFYSIELITKRASVVPLPHPLLPRRNYSSHEMSEKRKKNPSSSNKNIKTFIFRWLYNNKNLFFHTIYNFIFCK